MILKKFFAFSFCILIIFSTNFNIFASSDPAIGCFPKKSAHYPNADIDVIITNSQKNYGNNTTKDLVSIVWTELLLEVQKNKEKYTLLQDNSNYKVDGAPPYIFFKNKNYNYSFCFYFLPSNKFFDITEETSLMKNFIEQKLNDSALTLYILDDTEKSNENLRHKDPIWDNKYGFTWKEQINEALEQVLSKDKYNYIIFATISEKNNLVGNFSTEILQRIVIPKDYNYKGQSTRFMANTVEKVRTGKFFDYIIEAFEHHQKYVPWH